MIFFFVLVSRDINEYIFGPLSIEIKDLPTVRISPDRKNIFSQFINNTGCIWSRGCKVVLNLKPSSCFFFGVESVAVSCIKFSFVLIFSSDQKHIGSDYGYTRIYTWPICTVIFAVCCQSLYIATVVDLIAYFDPIDLARFTR